jgi:hypothetical protein
VSDLALDEVSGDLAFPLDLISGEAAVRQALQTRL